MAAVGIQILGIALAIIGWIGTIIICALPMWKVLGIVLAVIGWIGTIVICALPMWKVTAFIGSNIITSEVVWEGPWMTCLVQGTGQMACSTYDTLLGIPQDLQASQILVVIAVFLVIIGLTMSFAGGKFTNCMEDESTKAKICIVSGIIFIIAGVLTMIPVCWSANTIISDFYNPLIHDAQRRELGASLYIGWGAAALLIIGGGLLCCNCPPRDNQPCTAKYSAARSIAASQAYAYNFP
ncbi:UNVERIFIED_CONTAM: hypothetical protein FKN15_036478 [Acipenser sinensis]